MNTLSKLPLCDPIVYYTHRYLLGHANLEIEFNSKRGTDQRKKFEDTIEYKRSIYTRRFMQCSALFGAKMAFLLGYISPIFHNLFHPFQVSYYGCLFLCLLTGHIIGMTLGMLAASYGRERISAEDC